MFVSEMRLLCPWNNQIKSFKIFRDSDIGINPYWQAHLIPNVKIIILKNLFNFIA
jgi:hypothetical protein